VFEFGIEKTYMQRQVTLIVYFCVVHWFGWCLCGHCKSSEYYLNGVKSALTSGLAVLMEVKMVVLMALVDAT